MPPIRVVPGAVRTGLWCAGCMTHGACECGVYYLDEAGPRVALLGVLRRCEQCDDEEE